MGDKSETRRDIHERSSVAWVATARACPNTERSGCYCKGFANTLLDLYVVPGFGEDDVKSQELVVRAQRCWLSCCFYVSRLGLACLDQVHPMKIWGLALGDLTTHAVHMCRSR